MTTKPIMSHYQWWSTIRIVKAASVADYLDRYYKRDRRTPTLLQTYTQEFEQDGYICTSPHDNIVGELIAWPSRKAIAKAERGKCDAIR